MDPITYLLLNAGVGLLGGMKAQEQQRRELPMALSKAKWSGFHPELLAGVSPQQQVDPLSSGLAGGLSGAMQVLKDPELAPALKNMQGKWGELFSSAGSKK